MAIHFKAEGAKHLLELLLGDVAVRIEGEGMRASGIGNPIDMRIPDNGFAHRVEMWRGRKARTLGLLRRQYCGHGLLSANADDRHS